MRNPRGNGFGQMCASALQKANSSMLRVARKLSVMQCASRTPLFLLSYRRSNGGDDVERVVGLDERGLLHGTAHDPYNYKTCQSWLHCTMHHRSLQPRNGHGSNKR